MGQDGSATCSACRFSVPTFTLLRLYVYSGFKNMDFLLIEQVLDHRSLLHLQKGKKAFKYTVFYLLLLQLVLCRVAALKSLPVHHP